MRGENGVDKLVRCSQQRLVVFVVFMFFLVLAPALLVLPKNKGVAGKAPQGGLGRRRRRRRSDLFQNAGSAGDMEGALAREAEDVAGAGRDAVIAENALRGPVIVRVVDPGEIGVHHTVGHAFVSCRCDGTGAVKGEGIRF